PERCEVFAPMGRVRAPAPNPRLVPNTKYIPIENARCAGSKVDDLDDLCANAITRTFRCEDVGQSKHRDVVIDNFGISPMTHESRGTRSDSSFRHSDSTITMCVDICGALNGDGVNQSRARIHMVESLCE